MPQIVVRDLKAQVWVPEWNFMWLFWGVDTMAFTVVIEYCCDR